MTVRVGQVTIAPVPNTTPRTDTDVRYPPLDAAPLPRSLALVDDDAEFTEFLARYLGDRGVRVDVFADSTDLLTHPGAYDYDFYIIDLGLPGIDGLDLIKVMRRRTDVGLIVVSGRLGADVFAQVVDAGADMYLAKPVQFDQIALAIRAVVRRAGLSQAGSAPWKLDRRARQLVAPDGARVDLSDADLTVMACFLEANGETVSRENLRLKLGRPVDTEVNDGLNATIYRLRRRIERATPTVVPLQSKSRVGYVFKAPLKEL
jgi:DNA-binding response OmpR family regulator